LGKSIGHGIREFKDGITGKSTPDEEERPELTAASATPSAATTERDAAEVASPERRS
jgi:Sec-independent protein translocase protein TatA